MRTRFHGPRSIALLLMLTVGLWSSPAAAQSHAEQLLWQGKVDAALQVATEAADARPHDLEAQELLIDLLLATAMPARAERRARERLKQHPTDPNAHYLLGRAVTQASDARAAYENALRLEPEHARSHMGVAAVHLAEGRLEAARDGYQRAVSLDPGLSEAWLGLVRARVALDDPAGALDAARRGVQAVPSEGGLYLALSLLEPERAREVLERGARAAPHHAEIHEALAGVLLAQGEAKQAATAARKALDQDPRRAEAARHLLFAAALEEGRLDHEGYRRLVGARAVQDQDPTQAAATFDALVARYPDTALTWLARAQLRQGTDPTAALDDLARAVQVEPTNIEAQAAYGLLLLGAGKAAEAREPLRASVAARPWDASLGLALGRAHLQHGDPEAAALELGALHGRHPWDVDVVLLLAQAWLDAERPDRAWQVLVGMLRRAPDPRLAAALVMAAPAAGRHREAADLLEQLATKGGSAQLRELAVRLRAAAEK